MSVCDRVRSVLLLALLSVTIPAVAQTNWRHERPVNINLFQLREVNSADSLHAVAVGFDGFYGMALRTTDGGLSWSTVFQDSAKNIDGVLINNLRLYDVAHPTSDLIIIVADSVIRRKVGSSTREEQRGVILRSVDAGKNWTSTVLDSGVSANRISMADAKNGLVNALGGMFRTVDGGANWMPVPFPDASMRSAVDLQAITPTSWIVVGSAGQPRQLTAFRTTNAGSEWSSSKDELPSISRVRFVDSLLGWGVGSYKASQLAVDEDVIARTTDGGMTWTTQLKKVVGVGGGLMNVAFLDSRRGRAVGRNAKLLQTVDGGETWEVEQSGVSGETAINFLGIAWPSEKTVMVTTLFGYLLRHQESAIPAPPTILNPVSRSEDQPLSVSIEWVPVEGAIGYHLQVGREDAGFVTGVFVDEPGLAGLSYPLNDLEPNVTYAVRVRTVTSTDTGNWSSMLGQHTFTTGDGISSIELQRRSAFARLQVWPNPAHESRVLVRTRQTGAAGERVRLTIHDLLGRVILEKEVPLRTAGETGEAELEIESLPSGSYRLVVDDGTYRGTIQLVVAR